VVQELVQGLGQIRANVYHLASFAEQVQTEGPDQPIQLDTTQWTDGEEYFFFVEAENSPTRHRATLRTVASARRHFAYYNPWDPIMSLSVVLDRGDLRSLGFTA
jgi:hypothetical protein